MRERAFDACTHSGAIHTAGYDGIMWYQSRIGLDIRRPADVSYIRLLWIIYVFGCCGLCTYGLLTNFLRTPLCGNACFLSRGQLWGEANLGGGRIGHRRLCEVDIARHIELACQVELFSLESDVDEHQLGRHVWGATGSRRCANCGCSCYPKYPPCWVSLGL